jgi:replicative DNA helicase
MRGLDPFRQKLVDSLTREELLEIIGDQNPDLLRGVERIEFVFKHKLRHLKWESGPEAGEYIQGKPLTREELSLLIDEPFKIKRELTAAGLDEEQQRKIHIAKDPVTWARSVLKDPDGNPIQPRVYQVLVLRHPSIRKVLRQGRRSGKSYSLALFLLHWAYIHNNAKCLIITPQKEQGGLIYKSILEFVQASPIIEDSISRNVTSPQYKIELSNGSEIKFFSSGVNSGGKANIVRGQEADVLVLDELDYMHPDDITSLYAMLQTTREGQEEKVLIAASTPTGQRTTPFWEFAHNPRFTEFWFPSMCNPFWTQDTEDEMRGQYSVNDYAHEFEADWGEDVTGVYPRRYLDRQFLQDEFPDDPEDPHATKPGWKCWDYTKPIPSNSSDSFYVMGIDWDKYGAGTNMVVLEVCGSRYEDPQFRNKVKCIFREETRKDEYSYLNAVKRIIALHKVFNFRHIYADAGAGETQIEMLHKHGELHPETKLRKVVKRIAFGEAIELTDPETFQKDKKPIKPFMVDNLHNFLEKEYIYFSAKDQELYTQLVGYRIKHVTEAGRPVFEPGDNSVDHAHDALILACLAITQNYGDLMKLNLARYGTIIQGNIFQSLVKADTDESTSRVALNDQNGPVLVRRAFAATKGRATPKVSRRSF